MNIVIQWLTSPMPKDGTYIMRWHKAFNAWLPVRCATFREAGVWIDKGGNTYWNEECFSEHWQPIVSPLK